MQQARWIRNAALKRLHTGDGQTGLREVAKGKVTLHLHLVRQIFPFATPSEIEDHIVQMYEKRDLLEGRLRLYFELHQEARSSASFDSPTSRTICPKK